MVCGRSPVPTIRQPGVFRAVYRRGRVLRGRHIALRFLVQSGQGLRLGVTIPKRVGTAVTRNRLRRRIREYARWHQQDVAGVDVVVDCRPGLGDLAGKELYAELDALWGELRRRLL
jgi:ribonuclease P protein component